jgi:GNAT superfamily N-acetyltransferase
MNNPEPRFLDLSPSNIEREHICCAIAGQQHLEGVERKKAFLADGFDRGLVFRKYDVRGKVFVEYAPAEAAWRPVVAPGYLVIHCLWVSGRYKGRRLGRDLLQYCLADAGKHFGVIAVSGRKPYLTDTRFYLHHGFELIEQTDSGFDLVCYRSKPDSPAPRFAASARKGTVPQAGGVHFEYTYQCPFVPDCVEKMSGAAREFDLPITMRELVTVEEAQDAASPFGTFGAFLYGRLITHELMSDNKFRKLLQTELQSEPPPGLRTER